MFRFRNALPVALALALTASLTTPVGAANDAPAIDSNWMSDSRVLSASQARQALAQLPDDAPRPPNPGTDKADASAYSDQPGPTSTPTAATPATTSSAET